MVVQDQLPLVLDRGRSIRMTANTVSPGLAFGSSEPTFITIYLSYDFFVITLEYSGDQNMNRRLVSAQYIKSARTETAQRKFKHSGHRNSCSIYFLGQGNL